MRLCLPLPVCNNVREWCEGGTQAHAAWQNIWYEPKETVWRTKLNMTAKCFLLQSHDILWRAVTGIKLLETYLYPLSYLRIHLLKSLLHFSSRWMFESWSLKLNGSVKWDSNWCLIWNRPPLKSKVGYWAWFRVLYTTYVRNKDSTKIALRNGKWLRSHPTNSLRLSTSDNVIMFPRPCWPPTPGQPTWSPTVTPWSVWPWTESKSGQENNNQSWEQNIQSILIIFIFSSSVVSLWLHQRVIKIHLSCF